MSRAVKAVNFVPRARATAFLSAAMGSLVKAVGPSLFLKCLCNHADEFTEKQQCALWEAWAAASEPVDMADAVSVLLEYFSPNWRMWDSLQCIDMRVDCERLASVLAGGISLGRVWDIIFAHEQVRSIACNHPTFVSDLARECRSSSVFDTLMRCAWGDSFIPPPDMLCRVLRNVPPTIAFNDWFVFEYLMQTDPTALDTDVLEMAVKYLPDNGDRLDRRWNHGAVMHPKWFDYAFVNESRYGIYHMLRQRQLYKWLETHQDWITRGRLTCMVETQSKDRQVPVQEIIRVLKTYATGDTRPLVTWNMLCKWCTYRSANDQEFIDMLRELEFDLDLVVRMDEFCAQEDVMEFVSPAVKQFLTSL